MGYLLRGGQYASCVHAGGLSCLLNVISTYCCAALKCKCILLLTYKLVCGNWILHPIDLLYSIPGMYCSIVTASIRRAGKVIFSACLSVHTPVGTPSPFHNTSTGPMSFLGGTPVISPRSLLRGYPSPGWVQMGVPWDGVHPLPGMEYPPPPG